MPYKDKKNRKRHDREYYKQRRLALIKALGGRCVAILPDGMQCTETDTDQLEVHHILPFLKRSRPNSKEYFNPKGKELRCKNHHKHTESWRRKRRR